MTPEDEDLLADAAVQAWPDAFARREAQQLAAFEALVLSQQPATQPWTPVTDYSFEARKEIEGEHPQLIKDAFQPTLVMDYGCGPGHLIAMLRYLGVETKGYEPFFRNAAMEQPTARPHIYRDLMWAGQRKYDLVICREVLEHCTVREIKATITELCRLSEKFVYATTRFTRAPTSLLSVDTFDDLDPTHITMLNQNFLRVLFVLEGFKRRADLEAKMDWQRKGRVLVYERV